VKKLRTARPEIQLGQPATFKSNPAVFGAEKAQRQEIGLASEIAMSRKKDGMVRPER